ncbi:MAG: zinc transporter ZupT [Tannerellaceae bacterium]|jgi:ZIP family zinc transporter|nr:zinc transporter ZupT [Tannerellaceae bacterium]
MDTSTFFTAFLFTLAAGLSTGIGSLIALVAGRTNRKFLCFSLGLSAGVMIYIAFMEMLPSAGEALSEALGERRGSLYGLFSFLGGMGLIMLIDFLVPESGNPHEMHGLEEMQRKDPLHRMGFVVALSLAVHNFPEGIAVFTSALGSLRLGLPITLAIAVHNIPEGIAVSVPIYHATGSRAKAFVYSFLSGLAEPVGALTAYFFLLPYWTPFLNGMILSAVSGVMVFISLDELLPSAEKYGEHHWSVAGLVSGMAAMGFSLYLFS